MEIKLRN